MNYIGKFISNFKDFYNDINASTLTGAIDVVVVRQLDGTYLSSPFHVRFGKIGVLRSREKVVDIEINGEPVDIHMKLGDNGEAYFVHPRGEDVELQEELNLAEARSQDSGYEAEEKGENAAAPSLTLRINVDEKMLSMVSDEQASEIGVVSRVPRQDSSKSVRRDIKTQTSQLPTDKDSSSADEVASKMSKKSSGDKKTESPENKQKTDVEETSKSSRSQKRKRRKQRKNNSSASSLPQSTQSLSVSKSFGKKKSSGSQSSDASTTSEVADFTSLNSSKDDGVFPMDDVNKVCTATSDIPQSNSMPTLAEKPVTVMRPSQSDSSVVGPDERRWGDRSSGVEEKAGGNHKEYGINFHPFSDTDISPPPSPNNSRPSTPIKSDTEYEVDRERREVDKRTGREWDWTWGQLPTPPVVKHKGQSNEGLEEAPAEGTEAAAMEGTSSVTENQNGGNTVSNDMQEEEAERSMFSGVLSFMRATKKARHNPQAEGIYLEDLNPADLNPEVAALYFPKYSGAQKSVPGVDIPSGGVVSKEDDLESGNGTSLPNSPQSAGEAIGASIDLDGETNRHPVFDYKGYHDIAFSLCGRLKECADQEFPEPLFLQNLVTYDDFCDNPSAVLSNPDLVVRMGGKYLNWGSAAPHILSLVLFQRPLASTVSDNLVQMMMPRKSEGNERKSSSSRGLSWLWGGRGAGEGEVVEEKREVVEEEPEKQPQESEDKDTVEVCAAETQTSSFQETSDTEAGKKDSDDLRSLRLTTKQIEQLKLRDGANDIVFSVTTAYQGTTRCKCRLFLWNYDEKIIVSDIDGTITKSDVLGHIMPIIGNHWAQGGVAQLFTKIKNNGYNFLYLSARAIGQAHITREYLRSVVQEDMSLPDGPMLLNPSSLFKAFHSEVIERKSEEFKKSCLLDIQALYPSESNPFYAGYGNRINDVLAYKTVGIPMSRVFTINHKGEVRHEMTQTFQSSYTSLSDIAHHMFPVYSEESLNHGEYSSVRFWKSPLPDYDDEINQLLGQAAGK